MNIKGLLQRSRWRQNEYFFHVGGKIDKHPIIILLPQQISSTLDKYFPLPKKRGEGKREWKRIEWIWEFEEEKNKKK